MSDHLRISSPISSSPGRPTAIARPAWPWQASPLRSSSSSLSSLEYRPSLAHSSRPICSSGAHGNSTSVSWQSTPRQSQNSSMGNTNTSQEETTQQWTFMGFEWAVRDVHKLRNFVEGLGEEAIEEESSDFEILKQSPVLGDSKFKLEIACVQPNEGAADTSTTKPRLSLYITSLMVDFAHADYESSASMMTAIKCQADRVGERGAPAEWVWEFWQMDWTFRQGHEVWECPLPPLSALLENARIRETDSLVICVQIHCPYGPSFPQQPSVYSVPRDLLEGLEASLDNPNTGDVRFVCLERLTTDVQTSPISDAIPLTDPRSSSSASSSSPFSSQITARKRIIYAHSDILTRRSEYFANMLASSFLENTTLVSGERKLYTVVVEEAEFETIYWLLKYCYANWLLFKEHDDPRAAMDGVGVGWSAKWLNSQGGEWDWKTFSKSSTDENNAIDARSAASGESLLSGAESQRSVGKSKTLQPSAVPTAITGPVNSTSRPAQTPSKAMSNSATTSRQPSTPASRRTGPTPPASGITLSVSGSASVSRTKPVPVPVTPTNYAPSAHPSYPISPRSGRQNQISIPDPHPHPTPALRPTSALSMYQVAHRYAMPTLATLALEHIMNTITPQSSFAMLLATSVWDELHMLVEDYVVDKWEEVSVSDEFEQCCQEVAAGEYVFSILHNINF